MQPYLTDIDATLDNVFSCIINSEGGTKVVAYNLFINDLNNNQIYTTGKTNLTSPLYNGNTLNINIPLNSGMINGNDYIWNITIYEELYSMWVTYGVTQSGSSTTVIKLRKHFNVKNGMYLKIKNETRKITNFDESSGNATVETAFTTAPATGTEYTVYSDFIESSDIYFKARKTPIVNITNFPTSTVTSRIYEFIGSYTQENNVMWKYFEWILYDINNEVVQKTGRINTGEIKYKFDGFLDNTTYQIELIVENQDGTIMKTEKKSFLVDYEEPILLNKPGVSTLCDKDALYIKWSQPYINIGTATGITEPYYELIKDEPYIGGSSVWIKNESKIEYEPSTSVSSIDIPYESTTCLNCKFPIGFQGNIVKLENTTTGDYYNVSYIDGSFYYDINGEYTGRVIIEPESGRWLLETKQAYKKNARYVWDDKAIWDDNKFWSEQQEDILANNWWKITLLPTHIIVTESDVYHENIFNPPNTQMEYNTRLYNDYKLINTDVLYV